MLYQRIIVVGIILHQIEVSQTYIFFIKGFIGSNLALQNEFHLINILLLNFHPKIF
jgi:hypothetical protein